MTKQFTMKGVLARITEGPTKYSELTGPYSKKVGARLTVVLRKLISAGLVRKAYIGGIPFYVLAEWDFTPEQKLEEIESRCRRTVDGCLEWTGYMEPGRGPIVCIGKGAIPSSGRLVVWTIKRGAPGYRKTVDSKCGNEKCLEYRHLTLRETQASLIGKPVSPLHLVRATRANRARGKLDMEKVRRIRASRFSDARWGKALGVSERTIRSARRGETWREEGGLFTALIPRRATA